jgi:uncharacterized YigZ family protein
MLFDDRYKTIAQPSDGIFKDKGSKFMAYAFPIRSEEQAKAYLAQLKAEHPKARHHCWAFRLSPDRSVFRLNDDGEPSGTAGRPILNTLLSQDLTNILVVVVRYFGGTLLGVPGLIHAYKSATADAIARARIVEMTVRDVYAIEFDYLQMNNVMKIIKDHDLHILSQQFENTFTIHIEIAKTRINEVLSKFDKLSGVRTNYLTTT